MQYVEIDGLAPLTTLIGARPELMLVDKAAALDPQLTAARARVRHSLARALQEFLDRAGFTELDGPPDSMLAAALRRTCWTADDGALEGLLVGAGGPALLDLLERGLLAVLQGTLNRSATDLQILGVDLDRLKYVCLPVRRVRRNALAVRPLALARDGAATFPAGQNRATEATAEPILLLQYAPEEHDGDGASWLGARLLMPGAGRVAAALQGGRFSFHLPALARFICATDVARLARPAGGCD